MQTYNQQTRLAEAEFISRLMKEPVLSKQKEFELASAWRDHRDEKAIHQIICSFARLVISMALKFRFYGVPLADLIQEGNIGLMIAADRFEPDRGIRFSTYAKWWIRACIQDFVLRNWSIVRTGSTTAQKQLFFNLGRLKSKLKEASTTHLLSHDREEIAKTLNVTIQDVEEMEKRLFTGGDLSLNAPVREDLNLNWQDFIMDLCPSPEEEISHHSDRDRQKEWIEKAFSQLTEREQFIIEKRRLVDFPKTLEELSHHMKISKERIRQIEIRAMRKMRLILLQDLSEIREML